MFFFIFYPTNSVLSTTTVINSSLTIPNSSNLVSVVKSEVIVTEHVSEVVLLVEARENTKSL